MRFLALTTRPIESRTDGYDRRVRAMAAYLPGPVHLVVSPARPGDGTTTDPGSAGGAEDPELFASVETLPARLGVTDRLRSQLCSATSRRPARAPHAAAARARLAEVVADRAITHVVAFGDGVADLVQGLDGVSVVLDGGDSDALCAQRTRLAPDPRAGRGWSAIAARFADARRRPSAHRRTDPIDLSGVLGLPGAYRAPGAPAEPHGDSPRPLPAPGERRGVVFFGNLAAGAHRDALRSFVHDIWVPRLRDHEVELCVVGGGAPGWLVDLAAAEPGVVLTGPVTDLRGAVGRYPVMIDPARGAGSRDRILEAFHLGLVVVSTPVGVEAVPAARDDRHLALAPAGDFGAAVLSLLDDAPRRRRLRDAAHALLARRYRWDATGRAWVDHGEHGKHREHTDRSVPRPRPAPTAMSRTPASALRG